MQQKFYSLPKRYNKARPCSVELLLLVDVVIRYLHWRHIEVYKNYTLHASMAL